MKGSIWYILFVVLSIALVSQSCIRSVPTEIRELYEDVEEVTYNQDIRPILSDRCFSCHGPDANTRKAGLRLDIESEAKASLVSGNGRAIIPNRPQNSMLIQRIFSEDAEIVMPTPESKLKLTSSEKALIYKWIEKGAKYEDHWAFIPPTKPKIPQIENIAEAKNNIDHFVLDKLNEEGLKASEKASKERLLRRLSMDLTGLPPSIKEMDDFIADNSEDAYERAVDRLLSSNAYGERMAMEWMDLARYADSHGMHADGYRMMWPWRDWVIDAFNQNISYDEFVTWQIAGDMLPDANFEQKLATAFNRNHTMTAEGGAIDEEFRLTYVFDRTETMGTAFLGLTIGCARCHDHKFDPISQKEYYEMAAFFNNVKELGMTGDDGNYGPMLPVISDELRNQLTDLDQQVQLINREISNKQQHYSEVKDFIEGIPRGENTQGRIFYGKLDKIRNGLVDNNKNFTARGANEINEGIKGKAFTFTGEYDELYIKDLKDFQAYDQFSANLWINTSSCDSAKTQTLLCNSGEKNNFWRGWEFYLDQKNRLSLRLIHSLPHNYLHARSIDSIKVNEWQNVSFSYDGSTHAEGINFHIDGKATDATVVFDQLYKNIQPITVGSHKEDQRKPIRVAKSYRNYTGEYGVFHGQIDEIKIYDKVLSDLEVEQIVGLDAQGSKDKVQGHFVLNQPEVKDLIQKRAALIKKKFEIYDQVDEVMVMEEMAEKRTSYVYARGEYTQPTIEVEAQTPNILPKMNSEGIKTRLDLAEWLFRPDHPLTARVTVNRYWQMIFGTGIVSTSNDFGVQGARPSHPDLLDYLALRFIEQGWDVKWLLKEMVMSSTYQQSSRKREDLMERDPENLLLARGPSYRYQAEMIRDNALAASGLIVTETGGESVKPYQPEGLWIEKSSFSHQLLNYKPNSGDSLYRRSLYTFIRRTSPPPFMTIFDAPTREVCTIKRENTSTPLQALSLLNDPQFVEAARILAERIQVEGKNGTKEQIQQAFRLAIGRKAREEELKLLEEMYEKKYAYFEENPGEAKELISEGEFSFNESLDERKTAALTMVTSTIINHNEAYMKR